MSGILIYRGLTSSIPLLKPSSFLPNPSFHRLFTSSTRFNAQGIARRRIPFKSSSRAPSTSSSTSPSLIPLSVGQGALAGAAALGLGTLAYYGLGLSNEAGALDRQVMWPQYVRTRIRDTYAYFGASLGVSVASAAAVFRSPTLFRLVSQSGWIAIICSIGALMASGTLVRSIPYQQGQIGTKQLAWLAHAAIVGAVVAPICLLGGPILTRAAWYTAGMVGALSTVAATAPSDKFLSLGAPLAMGLGVVFMSSIASAFLPPTTSLGLGVYSVALYGGLIVFGGFLLYDTQKIIHRAERHPPYGLTPYDPINNSISLYMDTINIFIRIAQMLAMGGGNKK